MTKIIDKLENNIKEMHWWLRIKPDLPSVCLDAIEVMEESLELLKERLPRKVKNIRDLADLLIGQCPSCGVREGICDILPGMETKTAGRNGESL